MQDEHQQLDKHRYCSPDLNVLHRKVPNGELFAALNRLWMGLRRLAAVFWASKRFGALLCASLRHAVGLVNGKAEKGPCST